MSKFSEGDKVEWSWGSGTGTGKVVERFSKDVTREIKGTEVKRKATDECPAYMIEQEDGGRVLKSHGELSDT